MTSKQSSTSSGVGATPEILKVLGGRAYHRIDAVAENLGCTRDDLLHMGAIGKVELCAPVIAGGRFEWPTGSECVVFPEVDGSIIYNFGATDRVILSMHDLAHIEATGWVIPRWFYSPATARDAINSHSPTLAEVLAEEKEWQHLRQAHTEEIRLELRAALDENRDLDDKTKEQMLNDHERNASSTLEITEQSLSIMRERGFNSVWCAVDDFTDNTAKTTIEHLFISAIEYTRLLKQEPQDEATLSIQRSRVAPEAKTNGHHERHALPRYQILMATLWHYRKLFSSRNINATDIAREIDEKSDLFWRDTGKPPLERSTVEEMLRQAFSEEPSLVLITNKKKESKRTSKD